MSFSVGDILFITTPLQTYEVTKVAPDSYTVKNQREESVTFPKSSAEEIFTRLVDVE